MDNLLNKNLKKEHGFNKGATITGLIVGIVLGVVLVLGVAVPISQNMITAANFTTGSVEETIANVIPVMLMIVPVVMVAQML